ncbi:MAG: carbon-nitrogen hydrolase family protein [Candidatus Zixiibacteriota bacterium]
MMIRIVLCQLPIGNGALTLRHKLEIMKRGADFVCLPEYVFIPPGSKDYSAYAAEYERNILYLAKLSKDLNTTLIGGSIVMRSSKGMHNTSFVFSRGYRIGCYSKVYPTVGEMEKGIMPGKTFSSWNIGGVRVGVLVCADVLHPESFDEMGKQEVDIIFVPTTSPHLPDDTLEAKNKRDEELFVKGAHAARSYVAKTCAVGSIFGKKLQGRSLITSPEKLLWNVFPESESEPIIHSYDLDISNLQQYRRKEMIARHVMML